MGKKNKPTDEQISSVMAELGRRGGKAAGGKGGKAALGRLTPEERTALAKKAAAARWEAAKAASLKGFVKPKPNAEG